ncbi:MAG: gephyrin-like molybdotransferase Glp [Rhodanobacter sp.]
MIGYGEALARLLASATPIGEETSTLKQASGRVLARDLESPMALPSFDHAAMDGYALFAGAGLPDGSEHVVHGSLAAGNAPPDAAHGAWEIMTGACLPPGLDAVIAVERTELLETPPDGRPARIRLRDPLVAGGNVRVAGMDVARGSAVLTGGTTVGAAQIMLLAALGVSRIPVRRRLRVSIICTGKELQTDPSQPLTPGRIHNSNGPYLAAELLAAGAQVTGCETVDDSAVTYAEALKRATDVGADLVVSTGAVSMGRYDFVPEALVRLKAQILFHKVAIRPGRPLLAARLRNGPLLLALPGTPMAVAVGLRFFVLPLLRAMTGQTPEKPSRAILATSHPHKPGLRHFLRASLSQDDNCRLLATVPSLQQPFRIHSFAHMNAWVVVPEDAVSCDAGMAVDVVIMRPAQSESVVTTTFDDAVGMERS